MKSAIRWANAVVMGMALGAGCSTTEPAVYSEADGGDETDASDPQLVWNDATTATFLPDGEIEPATDGDATSASHPSDASATTARQRSENFQIRNHTLLSGSEAGQSGSERYLHRHAGSVSHSQTYTLLRRGVD